MASGEAQGRSRISASVARAAAKNGTLKPSARQEFFLQARGRWRKNMTRGEATDLIGRIKHQEAAEKSRSKNWPQ
jgi:hypothetical protein